MKHITMLKIVKSLTLPILCFTLFGCESDPKNNLDLKTDSLFSDTDIGQEDVVTDDMLILEDESPDLEMATDCQLGCVVEQEFVGTFPRADIKALVSPNVIVDNGYSIYWITFKTNGRLARPSVTIPVGVQSPDSGWQV